jgi:hypothetical protein
MFSLLKRRLLLPESSKELLRFWQWAGTSFFRQVPIESCVGFLNLILLSPEEFVDGFGSGIGGWDLGDDVSDCSFLVDDCSEPS